MLKLLARHHTLQGSAIRIDGHNIAEVQWKTLHRKIAKVSQSTELFHRSIRNNIRFAAMWRRQAEIGEKKVATCRS